jgi:rhodanese-related sulfurtransferase
MIPDLKGIGLVIDGMVHVSGNEVIQLCEKGAILVDIREEYETAARRFAIENTIFFPYSVLKQNYNDLPKDKLLIIADGVGLRSKEAVLLLKNNGYSHVINLAGGIVDWEREGYKVIKNKAEMFHGQCACMLKSNTGRKADFK